MRFSINFGCAMGVLIYAMLEGSAGASLLNRGNGMIYDSSRNITWLQDANYAKTSGYDPDGKVTLARARSFANNLVYQGYDDWLLPGVWPYSYEVEMETLLEVSLLNPANGTTPQVPKPGPFINITPTVGYWHIGRDIWSTQNWYFIYNHSTQQTNNYYSGESFGDYIPWPMRYGDVGMLPSDYNKSLYGGNFSSFQGWTVSGGGSAQLVNHAGSSMVKLTTGSSVHLHQLLDTPAAPFTLAYELDMSETWGQTMMVYLGGTLVDIVYNTTQGLVQRNILIENPNLLGLSETQLKFTLDDSAAGKVAYIDNIAFIPEPMSMVLMGLLTPIILRRPGIRSLPLSR
ncbi:MAG: DUF1566 domain-containing protein [Phycisphaerales bacterium]|nr:DUF1566 domain-containing protein [Phycisphaerales bacterium]